MNHREFIHSLSKDDRKRLFEKTNVHGIVQTLGHFGLIAVCIIYIYLELPLWQLVMVPLGILHVFLFTAEHEATHRTAFVSKRANDLLAIVTGLIVFIGPLWYRYYHFAHHRYTQDPKLDPENLIKKPQTLKDYLIHVSGIPQWSGLFSQFYYCVTNNCDYHWIPKKFRPRLVKEARLMLVFYLSLLLVSIALNTSVLLWVWIFPLILGQPFLRVYLLAEHGGCPEVENMLENTRTTITTEIIRKLAWNMPYHAEHHALPAVPFHRLPVLHEMIKQHIVNLSDGYVKYNVSTLRTILGKH